MQPQGYSTRPFSCVNVTLRTTQQWITLFLSHHTLMHTYTHACPKLSLSLTHMSRFLPALLNQIAGTWEAAAFISSQESAAAELVDVPLPPPPCCLFKSLSRTVNQIQSAQRHFLLVYLKNLLNQGRVSHGSIYYVSYYCMSHVLHAAGLTVSVFFGF